MSVGIRISWKKNHQLNNQHNFTESCWRIYIFHIFINIFKNRKVFFFYLWAWCDNVPHNQKCSAATEFRATKACKHDHMTTKCSIDFQRFDWSIYCFMFSAVGQNNSDTPRRSIGVGEAGTIRSSACSATSEEWCYRAGAAIKSSSIPHAGEFSLFQPILYSTINDIYNRYQMIILYCCCLLIADCWQWPLTTVRLFLAYENKFLLCYDKPNGEKEKIMTTHLCISTLSSNSNFHFLKY